MALLIPNNSLAYMKQGKELTGNIDNVTVLTDTPLLSTDKDGGMALVKATLTQNAVDPNDVPRFSQLNTPTPGNDGWSNAIVTASESLVVGDKKIFDTSGGDLNATIAATIAIGSSFEIHNQGDGLVSILSGAHDIQQAGQNVSDPVVAPGDTILLVANSTSTVEVISVVSGGVPPAAATLLFSGTLTNGNPNGALSQAYTNFSFIYCVAVQNSGLGIHPLNALVALITPTQKFQVGGGDSGDFINIIFPTSLTVFVNENSFSITKIYGIP